MTPLTVAARYAADETISTLLDLGADPDGKALRFFANGTAILRIDLDWDTPLMAAIESNCVTTINLLAPVTHMNLGGALASLAKNQIKLNTIELVALVERAAEH